MEINTAQMAILRDAIDVIVAYEKDAHPEQDDTFWHQFHDVLLAMVIERGMELLSGEDE